MRYHVHIYTSVRVRVANVDADSPMEACETAKASVDFDRLLDKDFVSGDERYSPPSGLPTVTDVEWADVIHEYMVDQDGDREYENTVTISTDQADAQRLR